MRRTRKKVEQLSLNVTFVLLPDGTVEIDPKYNSQAITHLDELYLAARREEYNPDWTDEHKVAYFLADMIDGVLMQYAPPVSEEEIDTAVGTVPHINEAPVRDRFDIRNMKPARRNRVTN